MHISVQAAGMALHKMGYYIAYSEPRSFKKAFDVKTIILKVK